MQKEVRWPAVQNFLVYFFGCDRLSETLTPQNNFACSALALGNTLHALATLQNQQDRERLAARPGSAS